MLDKNSLSEDILREIASVGGEYGHRLERIIEEMERIRRAVVYLEDRLKRQGGTPVYSLRLLIRLRRRFLRRKREALEVRRNLIIYREAIGLVNHREVFDIYNIEKLEL